MPYDLASLSINLKQFELTLQEHNFGGWRELDNLTLHETQHSSRIMRTYHTYFGVLWGFLVILNQWHGRIV